MLPSALVHNLIDGDVEEDVQSTTSWMFIQEEARGLLKSNTNIRLEIKTAQIQDYLHVLQVVCANLRTDLLNIEERLMEAFISEQLKRFVKQDITVKPIRGNIATRLSKLSTQDYDAIIVAEAALNRLKIVCEYSTKFKISEMLPSASQGYIGIQCLNVKNAITKVIESINSKTDMILANAERSFVAQLDGSCTSPICILCTLVDEKVQIQAKVISLDGKRQIAKNSISSVAELDKNIVTLADQFISEGARSIIL